MVNEVVLCYQAFCVSGESAEHLQLQAITRLLALETEACKCHAFSPGFCVYLLTCL